MSVNDRYSYSAEMGFTHRELTRGLASAVEPYSVIQKNDRSFQFVHKNQIACLTMSEERVRKIAGLKLPIIDVKIEFENFSEDNYYQFLERFKKYLHRGGG